MIVYSYFDFIDGVCCLFVCIVGDWMYFIGIQLCNLDGDIKEQVCDVIVCL